MSTGYVGQQALEDALNAVYETGNVKAILLNNSHAPAEDTQHFYSDISANELGTANGYTAGGTAATCTVTRTGATNLFEVDFGAVSWTASGTLSAYHLAYIDDTGTPTTSKVLYQLTFTTQPTTATDAPFNVTASQFSIDFPD